MNSAHIRRLLSVALSFGFGVMASPAVADTLAPHELTAANLEIAIDTPMAEWIDNHKGPGAVVVVVTRDAQVFAKGYGFADIEAQRPFTADTSWCGLARSRNFSPASR
jgi:CubicO group peptidase (beta-lactamase class C family)